jgi:hypothetical protein
VWGMKEQKEDLTNEQKVLLTFLRRTKDGEYAKIDLDSLKYARMEEETIEVNEENYYYSIT